ncbi:unnamed protein product [Boreogadus saida]
MMGGANRVPQPISDSADPPVFTWEAEELCCPPNNILFKLPPPPPPKYNKNREKKLPKFEILKFCSYDFLLRLFFI